MTAGYPAASHPSLASTRFDVLVLSFRSHVLLQGHKLVPCHTLSGSACNSSTETADGATACPRHHPLVCFVGYMFYNVGGNSSRFPQPSSTPHFVLPPAPRPSAYRNRSMASENRQIRNSYQEEWSVDGSNAPSAIVFDPALAVAPKALRPMRILFLTNAHNGMSQALYLKLTAQGHQVKGRRLLEGSDELRHLVCFRCTHMVPICPFVRYHSIADREFQPAAIEIRWWCSGDM